MKSPLDPDAIAKANTRSFATLLRSIRLSQGSFSLILVRCNYEVLQSQIWQQLQKNQQLQNLPVQAVYLPSQTTTLFTSIREALETQGYGSAPISLGALVVFGLESVESPALVFGAANQVRDEFRKHFSCPVVLWITDEGLQQLTRFAPDFKSWATTSIKFQLPVQESVNIWWQTTENLFGQLLAAGAEKFIPNETLDLAPGCRRRQELEWVRSDMQLIAQATATPMSEATWQLILGRDHFARGEWERAIVAFEQSLIFWSQGTNYWESRQKLGEPLSRIRTNPFLEEKGLVLFHLGLVYSQRARQYPRSLPKETHNYDAKIKHKNHKKCPQNDDWLATKKCFSACLEIFAVTNHQTWVGQLILHNGEVLEALEFWSELKALGHYALAQEIIIQHPYYQARVWGFLARVALAQNNYLEAGTCASHALALCDVGQSLFPDLDPYHRALYLLLLARSYEHQQTQNEALTCLEEAKRIAPSSPNLEVSLGMVPATELYLEILTELRSLYLQSQNYEQAFNIKQEQYLLEHWYGCQVFYGFSPNLYSGELKRHNIANSQEGINRLSNWGLAAYERSFQQVLIASGRQGDLENLLDRLSRDDQILTILHGPSGVGKTSLLVFGLVPELRRQILRAREVLPVYQSNYQNWEQELTRAFTLALGELHQSRGERPFPRTGNLGRIPIWQPETLGINNILEQLQLYSQGNILTVLIFDQFEEFFFSREAKDHTSNKFYQFLQRALGIPFVKVILSLREDYLHHLLAIEQSVDLETIGGNLLDRRLRYSLGALTQEGAQAVIKALTNPTSQTLAPSKPAPWEETMIEVLVTDLAAGGDRVLPVELHLVCSQLEAERITTLAEYQQLGTDPKTVLVERAIATAITDCGTDNRPLVWPVLFSLTKENGTRPIRTRSDLGQGHNLNLVLKILVGSGLVSRWPDTPEESYQLTRDYLVQPIRQQYQNYTASQEQAHWEENYLQLVTARRQKWRAIVVGVTFALLALGAIVLAWQGYQQRNLALKAALEAQLVATSASAKALYGAGLSFDALLEALRAAKRLQDEVINLHQGVFPLETRSQIGTDTQFLIASRLEQALLGVREHNRLEGHQDVVWSTARSKDGELLVSGGLDGVKLWRQDGMLWQNLLTGVGITCVDLYPVPQGWLVVASGNDGKLRLWFVPNPNSKGQRSSPKLQELWQIQADGTRTYSVQFSPNGQQLVTAGADGMVKLWSRSGRFLKTFTGHSGTVRWATFRPDGKAIASAGEDRTVRLWPVDGQLSKTLTGATDNVSYLAFSPDGRWLASGGDDGMIRLWSQQGQLVRVWRGERGWLFALNFSPDSQKLVSGGQDGKIKLWTLQGDLIEELTGHQDGVTSVYFSGFGSLLVSSSYDKTVRLWNLRKRERVVLRGHQDSVEDVTFAPTGEAIATASKDGTVKLWSRAGQLLATLKGHQGPVESVSFDPRGEMVASTGRDGMIRWWSRSGQLLKILGGPGDWLVDGAWSPKGDALAVAGRDRTIAIWSREGKLREILTGHGDRVNAVAWSPDGNSLASASDDGTVRLWSKGWGDKFGARTPLILRGHQGWVLDVSFIPPDFRGPLPQETLLASAGYDNTIRFWNREGKEVRVLAGHTDSIAHLDFNRTGEILATTSWNQRLQLWRLDDTLIETWEDHLGRLSSVSWSEDGTAIATASEDRTVKIWNLAIDDLVNQACDWLKPYLENNARAKESDRHLCQTHP